MADTALRRRSAWAFLAVESALVLAAVGLGERFLTTMAAVSAFLVAVVTLVVRRPPRLAAWIFLAVAAGAVAFSRIYALVVSDPAAIMGLGNIRALVIYPAFAIGLILLAGAGTIADLADTLDASVIALGFFVLLWLFLLHGALAQPGAGIPTAAVRPVGIAVVVGTLVRLLFLVRPRAPAVRLVAVGVVLALIGAVALVGQAVGYAGAGRALTSGEITAMYCVLLATALLHPSAGVAPPRRVHGVPAASRLSRGRVAMFVSLTLLGPLAWLLAVSFGRFRPGSPADFGPPVLAAALIALLLLWRLWLVARLADRRAGQLSVAVGELQGLQEELAYRAAHDPLTGLFNRSVLIERLSALPPVRSHALLMADLDGFKEINDSLGHPAGDELLVAVGRGLTALAPPGATLVRLGGDEFAMLLPDTGQTAALAVGSAICQRLREPFASTHGDLRVSASVGLTAGPLAARSPAELLREADVALYAAKAAGKDQVAAYRPDLRPERRVRPR